MALAGTGFELAVRDLATLRPHEEVIESHVDDMARRLKQDGIQKDPIIIDGRTGTVLDGMHRLAAFAKLGIGRAVCCSVDYESDRVAVGRWARVYRASRHDELESEFTRVGFTKPIELEEAISALQRREIGVFVAIGRASFVPASDGGLEDAFVRVARLDQASSVRGWERRFVGEDEVEQELAEEGRAVVLVQRLLKEDVMSAAMSGRLFPCKTSMHTIDPRPVAVRYPLDQLVGQSRGTLQLFLSGRKTRLIPAGSSYEGRKYKERLLLLNSS